MTLSVNSIIIGCV